MARCPAIVGVVTSTPAGHRLEPLEVKVTCDPAAVDTPYLSASHASTFTRDAWAAPVAGARLVSPMTHTN